MGDDETDEGWDFRVSMSINIHAYGVTEEGEYTIYVYGRPWTPGGMYAFALDLAHYGTEDCFREPEPVDCLPLGKITVPTPMPRDFRSKETPPGYIPIGPRETHIYKTLIRFQRGSPLWIYRILPILVKPPGPPPKPIQPDSKGKTPIAILSKESFDAPGKVDPTSLRAGRTGEEASLSFCNMQGEDVDGDGVKDLLCHFETDRMGLKKGDTFLVLRGKTRPPYVYSFQGTYPIVVVPK
jgi:hypothetical protein